MGSEGIDPTAVFYNTTFHLHKVTHLNLNGQLNSPENLETHSTRLTNVIRGDVLRGVRVSEAAQTEDAASKAGNLNRVAFTALEIPGSGGALKAVAVIFKYDKTSYSAFLVQSSLIDDAMAQLTKSSSRRASLRSASAQTDQSNHYPLLLTRLPAWLLSRFFEYLVQNFDCHVSSLRFPDGFIMNSLEKYLEPFAPSDDDNDPPRPSKNLQISIEPPMTTKDGEDGPKQVKMQTLRTISMTFARDDLPGMLHKGQELKRNEEEEGQQEKRGPFELAVSLYAYHHMGMFVEKMKLHSATCGAFVTGVTPTGSGKCKFLLPEPRPGAESDDGKQEIQWHIISDLVKLAS